MTVARKSEIEAETGEILAAAEEMERPRKAQTELIAVQGQTFHLLEHLGEINGRHADLSRNVTERPTPPELRRQDELRAVDELLPPEAPARSVRGALAERAAYQRQHQGFRLQSFGAPGLEAVADERDQGLGARVDPQPLAAERERGPVADLERRRELAQPSLPDREREAGVATLDRVADAIAFSLIEEKELIRLSHRVAATDVTHVDAAIGEHEASPLCKLLFAPVPAGARAHHVAHGERRRVEEELRREFHQG